MAQIVDGWNTCWRCGAREHGSMACGGLIRITEYTPAPPHVHTFQVAQLQNHYAAGGTNIDWRQALVVCPPCGATKWVTVEVEPA